MTADVKYPKRFLDLTIDSPVEDSKIAYDEMAQVWEKVTAINSWFVWVVSCTADAKITIWHQISKFGLPLG